MLLLQLLCSFPAHGALTNTVSPQTNLLSICLLTDVPLAPSALTASDLRSNLKLITRPLLSDKDFVSWDLKTHKFVITPDAAKRLIGAPLLSHSLGFALVCSGEPIYYGQFKSSFSSASSSQPVILTDLILADCFGGVDEVPKEVWQMVSENDPHLTEHLLAMTNANHDVTLRIDRGYPTDNFAEGPDPRNDPRIVSAVEKLFSKQKP